MDVKERMKELGGGIVNEAFGDLFSHEIPSPMANRVLRRFARWWRDYTRAALIVMSCQAVGGDPKLVYPAAKSLVLAGGAFDLHDDIIDKSFIRRKARTKSIQGRYGTGASLLAGDALLIAGLTSLTEMPGLSQAKKREVVSEITKGLFELGSAEMEEMSFVHNLEATPRRYIRILWMKSADMESYTKVGAMIGNASKDEVEALGMYGRCLGMICILRDELEDTFNDFFELRSRILNESLPLPIVYSLGDKKCRSLLTDLFKKAPEEISDKELERLIEIIDDNHGFEKGQALINRYVRRAKAEAKKLEDPEPFLVLFPA
ncbi:MAG TPA: polyprenyl synthetase family protein [Methanomassiliicoccales archaeon]|nr:polyprenyl synthetase family protein [Methanomassiliicoccales archaeon]